MTDAGRRYVGLAAELEALKVGSPHYWEILGEMERIWEMLDDPEHEEVEGILIAINEVEHMGKGYPPAPGPRR